MAEATLDKELVEGLNAAKKTPRNYALVVKGANPVKLLVQKKKFQDGELAKAKAAAKGNDVITGVLVASGTDFAFQVLGEEPTIKPTKIKELIAEQAEMSVKPRWEIVTAFANTEDGQSNLAAWKAAREVALAQLREVAKEVAEANHEDSTAALIELKAVMANLTAEPTTPQQVADLERYLSEDDVVLDVCEFAHDVRTPLLQALATLKPATA